ncbi:MAG: hypothetical protein ACYYKD_13420 [Rhodospirillales bacterium]
MIFWPRVRTFFAFIALATLTACAAFKLVPPGDVETAADLTVTTGIAWSRQSGGSTEIWTLDGPGLQQLVFVEAKSGNPFLEGEGRASQPYQKNMTPLELRDMLKNNLEAGLEPGLDPSEITRIEETAFKPGTFGAFKGYRLELDFAFKDGLNRKGVAVFFVHEDNAYLVLYFGAEQVYFGKGLGEFEKIIATLRPS